MILHIAARRDVGQAVQREVELLTAAIETLAAPAQRITSDAELCEECKRLALLPLEAKLVLAK